MDSVHVDVNFNGTIGDAMSNYSDWTNLNLRQIGARLNVDGLSSDTTTAPDVRQSDLRQSTGDYNVGSWKRHE